jgi:hypothetical protein
MKFAAKVRTVTTKHDSAGDLFTEVSFRFYQQKPNGDKIARSTNVAMKLTGLQCIYHDQLVDIDIPIIEEE